MKKRVLLLILAISLFVSACGVKDNFSGQEGNEKIEENVDKSEVVAEKDEEGETIIGEMPVVQKCTYRATKYFDENQHVAIADFGKVSLSGKGFEKVESQLDSYFADVEDRAEQMADELCQEAIAYYANGDDGDLYKIFSIAVRDDVSVIDENIISILEWTHLKKKTHEESWAYEGLNFDMKSGKRLSMTDLATDDSEFKEVVVNAILDELGVGNGEDYAQKVRSNMLDDSWILTANGLRVYMNLSNSNVRGRAVDIPYSMLKDVMKPEYCGMHMTGVYTLYPDEVVEWNENKLICHIGGYSAQNETYESHCTNSVEPLSIELNGTETILCEDNVVNGSYLIAKPNGKIFLLISYEKNWALDDTKVFDVTEGMLLETDTIQGEIVVSNMSWGQFRLVDYDSMFGFQRMERNYHIDDNGKIVSESDMYDLYYGETDSQGSLLVKDLPVWVNGEKTIISAGTRVKFIATDNIGVAKLITEDGTLEAEVHFERNSESRSVYVDGVSEDEYIETNWDID